MSGKDGIAFSGSQLDRAGNRRGDTAWLATLRGSSNARVLPLFKLQPLLQGSEGAPASKLAFISGDLAAPLGGEPATEVFLGLDGDIGYFARDMPALTEQASAFPDCHFREARAAASVLPAAEVAILGQAKALIDWHARHPFCARCGGPTVLSDAGYRRVCSACKAEHFPRTDPAVIMLVTAGDRCLLARNRRFVGGHYSTLAGFVEPGETIEEAVRREVLEEVGIAVGRVRYFASQPWPFPASLMIGCFAESLTDEIGIDGEEIVAARWCDRALVKKLVNGESTEVGLPRRDAIAFQLVKAWVEES